MGRIDTNLHHLYNNEGTHTGRIPNPVPGSDFRTYEARLPNSYYREYGETKYAGADTFATTTIRLVGEALGSFTFDIDETLGDTLVASTTWKDIPVTASSTLTLDIQTLASTVVLQMDVDGDGITDTALLPGDGVTSQELLAILKGVIKTLNLADEKEEKLLKRTEKIEKELEKERKNESDEKQKTAHTFEKLMKTIEKFEEKGILTDEEAGELLEVVAKIQTSVVK